MDNNTNTNMPGSVPSGQLDPQTLMPSPVSSQQEIVNSQTTTPLPTTPVAEPAKPNLESMMPSIVPADSDAVMAGGPAEPATPVPTMPDLSSVVGTPTAPLSSPAPEVPAAPAPTFMDSNASTMSGPVGTPPVTAPPMAEVKVEPPVAAGIPVPKENPDIHA